MLEIWLQQPQLVMTSHHGGIWRPTKGAWFFNKVWESGSAVTCDGVQPLTGEWLAAAAQDQFATAGTWTFRLWKVLVNFFLSGKHIFFFPQQALGCTTGKKKNMHVCIITFFLLRKKISTLKLSTQHLMLKDKIKTHSQIHISFLKPSNWQKNKVATSRNS